jgi:formate hydrogenlyase subunit 4
MEKFRALLRQTEFHVLMFFVCLFVFGWPLATSTDLKQLELTFVYIFVAWAIVILLLFLVSRSQDDVDDPE